MNFSRHVWVPNYIFRSCRRMKSMQSILVAYAITFLLAFFASLTLGKPTNISRKNVKNDLLASLNVDEKQATSISEICPPWIAALPGGCRRLLGLKRLTRSSSGGPKRRKRGFCPASMPICPRKEWWTLTWQTGVVATCKITTICISSLYTWVECSFCMTKRPGVKQEILQQLDKFIYWGICLKRPYPNCFFETQHFQLTKTWAFEIPVMCRNFYLRMQCFVGNGQWRTFTIVSQKFRRPIFVNLLRFSC